MKVEQACRFRLDSGYGISARSPGFDAQQEKSLGEVFNDTMNTVFPGGMGSSVLSCITRGQYAFWARSTLRTDIHNRTTIFTHSYVIPIREYATMMEQMPEKFLAMSMDRLFNVQTGGDTMQTVEFPDPDCQELNAQALFEKYRLTSQRYAALLQGAYEAITGNRTINLYTVETAEDKKETLVRELTYCILEGMLPAMKKMVTFSSGPDARMRINVINDKVGLSNDALIFGVEEDQHTSIRSKDPMRVQMFQELGRATVEKRKQYLDQMEACLSELVNLDNCPPMQLIVAAYVWRCTKLTADTRLVLFRNFCTAAGKSLDIKVANQLLEELLQDMINENSVGTRELSMIAEWYLMDSSVGFRNLAQQVFQSASADICVALEDAILKRTPVSANARQLLCLLVNTVPADSAKITANTRGALMRWIISDNVSELLFFCQASLAKFDDRQMLQMVSDTLKTSNGQVLSDIQAGILKTAIDYLSEHKVALADEDVSRLDSHIPEYSDEMMHSAVLYLFRVRVAKLPDVEQAVDLLIRLGNVSPAMKVKIEAALPHVKHMSLMEGYRCRSLLPDNVLMHDIPRLCTTYNTFNNPDGPFEKRIYKLWIHGISKALQDCSGDLPQAEALTVRFLKDSVRLNVSTVMKNRMKETIVKQFWSSVTVESMVKHDRPIHHDISMVTQSVIHQDTNYRHRLLAACGRIKKDPKDTYALMKLLQEMTSSHPDYLEIKNCLPWLMDKVIMDCQYLSLDLLLLRCSIGNGEYDWDLFIDIIERTERRLPKLGGVVPACSAADSELLGKNAKLRTLIAKKMESGNLSELKLARQVARAMKGGGRTMAGRNTTVSWDGGNPASASKADAGARHAQTRQPSHGSQDTGKEKPTTRPKFFGGLGKK